MKTKNAERDATMNAAYVSVAISGAALLVGAGVLFGVRASSGVALGVVLAVSNLWVLERLVRAYLDSERGRWAIVALVKAAAIFGMVALLVKSGAVDVGALTGGYGALPLGIVIAGLWPQPSGAKAREEV
jgi:FtsH-binding integral membrane protein